MRAFAVSGYSGTGKTTLVEQIVAALVEQGYTVVTVKNTKHEVYDTEGTDSWKHMQAGAKTTVMLGPHSTVVRHSTRMELRTLLSGIRADFLIIEGLKESSVPKIWCVGDTDEELDTLPASVVAIVTWSARTYKSHQSIPVIVSSELGRIVELVKQEAVELDSECD